MSFSDEVRSMDAALFDEFAETALYNGGEKVSVVVDLDVEQFGGFDTDGPVKRHEVTFFSSQIPNPKRGQTIKTATGTFTLDGSISGDGHLSRWFINAS